MSAVMDIDAGDRSSLPKSAPADAAAASATAAPLVHVYTQNLHANLPSGVRPSAGALPTADRLAAPSVDTVFIGCQNTVNLVQPVAPALPDIRPGRQGPYASDFIPLTSRITPLSAHNSVHRTEVQNVQARRSHSGAANEYLVASVDSYGVGVVSRLQLSGAVDAAASPFNVVSSATLQPPTLVEDGWHGVSLHPLHDERVAVASFWGKSLSLYDGERLLQTLYTPNSPTSMEWLSMPQSAQPLLCVNEGNALSVWDVRMSNAVGQSDNISRGAVQRLQDAPGDLFALDTHHSGIVATGGVDKQVTVYDCRRWAPCGRWKNVLKYEIMSLRFSRRNLERQAFRGDARWVGLARTTDPAPEGQMPSDDIVGLTQTAQLYILRNAHLQNGPLDKMCVSLSEGGSAAQASDSSAAAAQKRRKEEIAAERRERLAQGLPAASEEERAKKEQRQQKKEEGRKRKKQEQQQSDKKPQA